MPGSANPKCRKRCYGDPITCLHFIARRRRTRKKPGTPRSGTAPVGDRAGRRAAALLLGGSAGPRHGWLPGAAHPPLNGGHRRRYPLVPPGNPPVGAVPPVGRAALPRHRVGARRRDPGVPGARQAGCPGLSEDDQSDRHGEPGPEEIRRRAVRADAGPGDVHPKPVSVRERRL
jgi:hypothetical protein